ncbi:hypothetical protein [uncultured Brachyspira sp.]|uniref:hypothetical protein n=1 Tax=uncultured Brachyspira sp. TaxID=221953 RepID=UPI0025E4B080|nr:hypothetical protein [uncultured Brachyspira sp.]
MKDNIVSALKSMQYYILYMIHNFDDIIESLLKISVFTAIIIFLIILIRKIDTKKRNKIKNKIVREKRQNHNREYMVIIPAVSVLALIVIFILSYKFFGIYYIMHNFDDVFEVIFQLAFIAVGIVLAKKILEKI